MTAGLMAIYRFPFAAFTVRSLAELCDKVYLRFDAKGDRDTLARVTDALGDKLG
jgi:hypothetical protein